MLLLLLEHPSSWVAKVLPPLPGHLFRYKPVFWVFSFFAFLPLAALPGMRFSSSSLCQLLLIIPLSAQVSSAEALRLHLVSPYPKGRDPCDGRGCGS